MARALDLLATSEAATVECRPAAPLSYGAKRDRSADVARVVRADGTDETTVFDLIRVDYRKPLYKEIEKNDPRKLAVFLGVQTLGFLVRWIVGFLRHRRVGGLGFRKRMQLLTGGLVLVLLFLVLTVTILAALSVPVAGVGESVDGWEQLKTLLGPVEAYVYPLIVFGSGVAAMTRVDLKGDIRELALRLAAAHDYLDPGGHKRAEVVAEVHNALEAVAESPERYGRVFLVGYSFGAVVALDASRFHAAPPCRLQKYVKALVTIGCPFDVIATYWPAHFSNRGDALPKLAWHNVYSPKDVLGSDFCVLNAAIQADSGKKKDAPRIAPDTNVEYPAQRVHSSDVLTLAGLTTHAHYWEHDNSDHPAAWGPVAKVLYEGEWALS